MLFRGWGKDLIIGMCIGLVLVLGMPSTLQRQAAARGEPPANPPQDQFFAAQAAWYSQLFDRTWEPESSFYLVHGEPAEGDALTGVSAQGDPFTFVPAVVELADWTQSDLDASDQHWAVGANLILSVTLGRITSERGSIAILAKIISYESNGAGRLHWLVPLLEINPVLVDPDLIDELDLLDLLANSLTGDDPTSLDPGTSPEVPIFLPPTISPCDNCCAEWQRALIAAQEEFENAIATAEQDRDESIRQARANYSSTVDLLNRRFARESAAILVATATIMFRCARLPLPPLAGIAICIFAASATYITLLTTALHFINLEHQQALNLRQQAIDAARSDCLHKIALARQLFDQRLQLAALQMDLCLARHHCPQSADCRR